MKDRIAGSADLRLVMNSGQLFHWQERGGRYYAAHSGRIIKLKQSAGGIDYEVFPSAAGDRKFVSDFLGLGRDYASELKEFASDA